MTLADVAKLAGVSTATVSRVINNHPRVSPNISKSVHRAMKSLKYVPSPPEQRRGRRTARRSPDADPRMAMFALMVPETRSAFYPSLLIGFSNAASKDGRQVTICETENCIERQAEIIIQLVNKKVAGVAIVPPTTMDMPRVHQLQLRFLQKENVPVVMLHRGVEGVKAPLIALPFEQIGYRAAQRLIDAGHRHVAYLALSSQFVNKEHVHGIRRALQTAGAVLPDEYIKFCGILQQKDVETQMPVLEATLRELLMQPMEVRPTAIICSFDYLAECVLDLLRRWGVSVPSELSIVSFGGAWRSSVLAEQLSAVTVDERVVGQQAVAILSELVQGELLVEQDQQWMVELGFHEGTTIAQPASAPLALGSTRH